MEALSRSASRTSGYPAKELRAARAARRSRSECTEEVQIRSRSDKEVTSVSSVCGGWFGARLSRLAHRNRRLWPGIALAVAAVGPLGCGATKQPPEGTPLGRKVEGSGFLGDLYPRMEKGEGDEPLRVYRSPTFTEPAAFARYTRIRLDPVAMFGGPDSKLSGLSAEERRHIADAVQAQVHDKLSGDYEMTAENTRDTLRLQVAVVDAEASWAKTEAISELPMPVGIPGAKSALVLLGTLLTGKPPFTGELTVEAKLSDAQTEEVVAAMIDRRVGVRKPIVGTFQSETYDSWADVDEAIRYFAERVRHTFCVRRGGTNCVPPKP